MEYDIMKDDDPLYNEYWLDIPKHIYLTIIGVNGEDGKDNPWEKDDLFKDDNHIGRILKAKLVKRYDESKDEATYYCDHLGTLKLSCEDICNLGTVNVGKYEIECAYDLNDALRTSKRLTRKNGEILTNFKKDSLNETINKVVKQVIRETVDVEKYDYIRKRNPFIGHLLDIYENDPEQAMRMGLTDDVIEKLCEKSYKEMGDYENNEEKEREKEKIIQQRIRANQEYNDRQYHLQ